MFVPQSDALASCQTKKAIMHVEGPPVKAVPEAVRNRPTPQRALCNAVLECVRNRAQPAPERTPLHERQICPGLPHRHLIRTRKTPRSKPSMAVECTGTLQNNRSCLKKSEQFHGCDQQVGTFLAQHSG